MSERRSALLIEVQSSHLYPGARGRLSRPAARPRRRVACVIAFSDGTIARGALAADDILRVRTYNTRRGTVIPEKRWQLRWDLAKDAYPTFRVAKPRAIAMPQEAGSTFLRGKRSRKPTRERMKHLRSSS